LDFGAPLEAAGSILLPSSLFERFLHCMPAKSKAKDPSSSSLPPSPTTGDHYKARSAYSSMQLPNRVFPIPYQVDFSVESKGRHFDFSKRKLIWKFGFAHPPAVFPHLFDANENYIGDSSNDSGSIVPYSADFKKGVECRGREHEIILSWSLLTGKAHLYVNSREIYRHQPVKDEIFNPFSASFHRGFDLPDSEFNGAHRIDIRCYARTPMGAKNMVIDENGGKFRQYDLSVDGLSYFSMPAVFELGTESMWAKVSRWGLLRLDSGTETFKNAPKGRMVDQYYFDKSKQRSPYDMRSNGHGISKDEYKAMSPRSESEEQRMMNIATNASLKEWEEKHSPPRSSFTENASHNGNGRSHDKSNRYAKEGNTATQLQPIVEDNLIDFGVDDVAKAMTQISVSKENASDVSVLDDDATTASFMVNTAWMSDRARAPPVQPAMSSNQLNPGQMYLNQQPQPHAHVQTQPRYYDPTFHSQYVQQPWGSVGVMPSPQVTPRNASGGLPSSDVSFAVPPPPTWDDYKDAFGGSSTMGGSVIGGYTGLSTSQFMSPMSQASVGMASPISQQQQWQSQQFVSQGGSGSVSVGGPSSGAPQKPKINSFDPMRSDPFAF
jgi:hypothetical protein